MALRSPALTGREREVVTVVDHGIADPTTPPATLPRRKAGRLAGTEPTPRRVEVADCPGTRSAFPARSVPGAVTRHA